MPIDVTARVSNAIPPRLRKMLFFMYDRPPPPPSTLLYPFAYA